MSEPKVPSWMPLKPSGNYYGQPADYEDCVYRPGESTAWCHADLTSAQLRDIADLIDSCQEAAPHKK